jgi:hypothetical protein
MLVSIDMVFERWEIQTLKRDSRPELEEPSAEEVPEPNFKKKNQAEKMASDSRTTDGIVYEMHVGMELG